MTQMPGRDAIEKKAYEIYERRGCEDGHAEDDWFAAERELNKEVTDADRSRSRIKTAVSQAMQQKPESARNVRN